MWRLTLINRVVVVLALVIVFVVPASDRAHASLHRRDWAIITACPNGQPSTAYQSAPLQSNVWLTLTNLAQQQSVQFGQRKYGIYLVWGNLTCNVRFQTPQGGALWYRQRFALQVAGGGYVRYKEQDYGINLAYSAQPSYEWEFRYGNKTSEIIYTSVDIALYNTVRDDYVIYCERDYGINLRWASDCHAPDYPSSTLTLGVRVGPYMSPPTQCVLNIFFTMQPTKLTVGSTGISLLSGFGSDVIGASEVGTDGHYCTYFRQFVGLRGGEWIVYVTTPSGNARCKVNLDQANEQVRSHVNKTASCRQGTKYP